MTRGRLTPIAIAVAMFAGACSGSSGDPENSAPRTVSYGGESSTTQPGSDESAAVPDTLPPLPEGLDTLPLDAWAAAGAVVSYRQPTFDVADFGAVAGDDSSDSDAFNAAIQAARAEGGGLVTIPEGTFLLTESVRLVSRVTLRGAGPGTRLELDFGDESGFGIRATGSADDNWTPLATDLSTGAELLDLPLTVEEQDRALAGEDTELSLLVEIEQENTPTILTQPAWDVPWGDQSEGEIALITGVDGDGRFVVDSPLLADYTVERGARVRRIQPVRDVGIEDLSIIRIDEGYGHSIAYRYTLNAWVNNVVSTRTSFAHVGVEQSMRCTVADSILHDATDFGDGGRAYGVSLARHVTGCVVANNTLYDLRHALIIQLGASGNVFAYNHARGSAGYEDRRPRADISLHGHWPQRNLFEGNTVDRIEIADWWGPAGPDNTFLRNCVLDHVILLDSSQDQRFAGNSFGDGGVTIDPSVRDTTFISNIGSPNSDFSSGEEAELPASLWRSTPPAFLDGQWPSKQPAQGASSCDLPASSRSPLGNR